MEMQIKDQMHKAFWNLIKDDLNKEPQNFDHLIILIEEIMSKLINLTPHRTDLHNELQEVLDPSFLKHIFTEKAMDPQHFFNLIIFLINQLKKNCAPYMDSIINKWEVDVLIKMQNTIIYADFVPYFFKQTYIKTCI